MHLVRFGFHKALIRLAPMTSPRKSQIILYSDDSSVRQAIISALGKKVANDLGEHEVIEFATGAALRQYIERNGVDGKFKADLFILDGEAVPEGGMGIARQLKDEVFNCPPVLLITGRPQDAWLAAWSRAEASISHPVDPFTLASTVADLLRTSALATS